MIGPPPNSPPFPYTTLFRSIPARQAMALHADPWTVSNSGNWQGSGMSPVAFFTANPHQCIRVDLNYTGGSTITRQDRKSTRLNSSHANISYAVFCLKKKKKN